MKGPEDTFREKLILALIQTLIFGLLLALFGFWLNLRLEKYKKELADSTEGYKSALTSNAALIEQRHIAYLDVQQAARELNNVLEIYYFRAVQPLTGQILNDQLEAVKEGLIPEEYGHGSSSTWVTNQDVIDALQKIVLLRKNYQDISSENINSTIDDFLTIIMDDVRQSANPENDTEIFHSAARTHLEEALKQLNLVINDALQLDKLPIH